MVIDLPKEAGNVPDLVQGDVRETSNIGLAPNITNFSESQHNHSAAISGGATTHASGDGSDHADVATNTTHKTSTGADHSYINQDVTTTGTPEFGITTLGDTSVLKTSGAPTADAQIANKKYVDDNALTNKTSYVSITGSSFHGNNPDVDEITVTVDYIETDIDNIDLYAHVQIPQGAIVTGAIIYGNAGASDSTWSLRRMHHDGGNDTLASSTVNTEDTSILNATIENQNYGYFFLAGAMQDGDRIYGARVTYTTDYI